MALTCEPLAIPDVWRISPAIYHDPRGFFLETYQARKYSDVGLSVTFVQDNHSHSRRGALRGLHYQLHRPQSKLVYAVTGTIYDVAVDIRRGSPTFGRWVGEVLSDENRRQLFIPEGFAHGFCVLSDSADVIYKCADFYDARDEHGILWSDPSIGVTWPVRDPILSEKDGSFPCLDHVEEKLLPRHPGLTCDPA